MKRLFFILAILGALLSGWVPAVAASLNAARPAGMHAMHEMAGEDGGSAQGKLKPAAHPVACSACFAIEPARLEPMNRTIDISARVSAAVPPLAGLVLPPLDPPPRS